MASSMSSSYEELVGAVGRNVYFRPERRRVRELLSRDAQPSVKAWGQTFPLFDLSLNGVSFILPSKPNVLPAVGEAIDLSVWMHGRPVFEGKGRVARTEPTRGGVRVGVALLSGFLDMPEIIRQDEEAQLDRELKLGPGEVQKLVPKPYQDAIARMVHFLQHYRPILDRHEARYKSAPGRTPEEREALDQRALDGLREPWTQLERAATEAALECLSSPESFRAAKRYTETLVTSLLLDSPNVKRAFEKPLGYPGDYQLMLMMYADQLEGDSTFARVFHKLFSENPLSSGVRTRKEMIVELTIRELERFQAARREAPFRATSLGCGPAREVADFVQRQKSWPGVIHWELIDQEDEALSVAYHQSQAELSRAVRGRGAVTCLNLSFTQILSDPSILPTDAPQDFIYSMGLFDYLRERRGQELVEALYARLAPGGLLVVGNAHGAEKHFWAPEMLADWTLLYRTRDDMKRLAARLPSSAELEVIEEPSNAYYFLLARKH